MTIQLRDETLKNMNIIPILEEYLYSRGTDLMNLEDVYVISQSQVECRERVEFSVDGLYEHRILLDLGLNEGDIRPNHKIRVVEVLFIGCQNELIWV